MMIATGTKVVVFLDTAELAILDGIAGVLLSSRGDAIRFMLAERKRAADKFKAVNAKPAMRLVRPKPKAAETME